MDDLIGFLVFIVIAIFGALARYKESQRAKKDVAAPPPPKPRPQPAAKPRWQIERREATPASPAKPQGQQRARTLPQGPRAPQRRPAVPGQAPAAPRQGAGPRPAPRSQPVLTEEELPRLKPEQVRARVEQVKIVRKQAVLEEMAAETAAERDKVKRTEQAAQAKIGSAATADLAAAQARQRRLAALPPLLRDAEGIRQGIIFSEIIGPPLALR